MAITNLQQARQMYALGQRVAKTLDGSRPGYRGRTDANTMSGSGYGAGSSTGSNKGEDNKVDPGFRNALDKISTRQNTITNQNNLDYGQFFGSRVPTYSPMSFGDKVGNVFGGIGDYIKGGGLIGMGIRGFTGLVDKFTGPKATEYGNLNIPGYNMLNIAGPKKGPPKTERGDDVNQLYTLTNQNSSVVPVQDKGIKTLVNNPDFIQRFTVKEPYAQASGEDYVANLNAIAERMKNFYT